jgi:hypothetical protein
MFKELKNVFKSTFLAYITCFFIERNQTTACYTVKKGSRVSRPRHYTKLSLGGNNDVITELFLHWRSLVSDIPAGDRKLVNLFYGVFF